MPPLILFIWAIVITLAFLGVAVAQMMMPDIDSFKMHSKLSQMMMPDIDFKKLHSKLSKSIHTDYTADGKSQLVTLKSGVAFQGTEDQHGISSFRGIRYGKAPVGNLRWAPPEMYSYDASSSTPIDASNFGDICVQSSGGKEDCLYLNVFVNLKTTSQNKESGSGVPVAVFVHGGSYKSGASNLYPGESLVDYWNGEGIMVTINYRLNVFGFAGSDALRVQDKTDGSTGNYGIQDQRLAFQWVKENIAAFGGDPGRVMIFGESAGAGSMAIHLTNKKSWGLFSSVILESGANSQWVMQPMKLAESTYQLLLQATTCTDVACLLAMDASALFAASQNVDTPMSHYLKNWSPVADGVEATTHPWISVQQGHVADVPMLHGANLDEGAMFCPLDKYTASEMQVYIMWMYADQMLSPTKMMSLYMDDVKYPSAKTGYTDSWYAAERSIGDIFIACPGKFTADTVSTQYSQGTLKAAKTFFYHFEHIPLFMKDKDAVYVNHGDELPYVLHLLQMMQNEGSPLDRRSRDTFSDFTTADLMATYWGNFLISHDPNKESGFGMSLSDNNIRPWGQYAANNGSAHAIREGTRAGVYSLADFRKAQCDYLIPNIDADIKKDFGTA